MRTIFQNEATLQTDKDNRLNVQNEVN